MLTEEENVVQQEEEEVNLEEISQIQDVVLREKLLSITRLISNIESLNENSTPDRVLNFFESDNSLLNYFSPEFETFCDHTEETRSGNTTPADNSLPEYDSFCFEIEPDQERLINVMKNDIPDNSSRDPLLEEADLFLASDNSIPPSIENVVDDSKGDIRFLEELLIDDSIPSHESSDSNFEDNPSIPQPPPEPPDAEFDAGKEIPVVINDKYEDVDYSFFLFDPKMFSLLLSAESDDTIFDPGFTLVIEVFLCWIFVPVSKIFTAFDLKLVWGNPNPLIRALLAFPPNLWLLSKALVWGSFEILGFRAYDITEESRRGMAFSFSGFVTKPQVSSFVAKSNSWNNNGNKNFDNNKRVGNSTNNRGPNPNLHCTNCGKVGHTVDRYFDIIGYPPGYNKNTGPKSNGPRTFNANSVPLSSKKGFSLSFTNEQMIKLMNLINEAPSGNVQANMAGHPNRTLAKIKYVGNLKLSDKIVLFDVLVVPELGYPSDQAVNMLQQDLNFTKDSHISPCDICHKAKQTKEPFSFSDHQTTEIVTLMSVRMTLQLLWVKLLPLRAMFTLILNLLLKGIFPHNISQGQPDLRRSSGVPKVPAKFNDYVVNSSKKYGLEKYVTYSNLNTLNYCFSINLNKSSEPTSYFEAVKNPNWIEAMNNEIKALNRNNTWTVCDLPEGRKAVGSKWLWKIKYKSTGEIEMYKARVVAKGFSQREGFDYLETFSHVVKMSVRCMLNVVICNG
nr:ribonuclease H-like domain-containing protein [Tanacetum cinerariifolium]